MSERNVAVALTEGEALLLLQELPRHPEIRDAAFEEQLRVRLDELREAGPEGDSPHLEETKDGEASPS